jgi:hypothetical protein
MTPEQLRTTVSILHRYIFNLECSNQKNNVNIESAIRFFTILIERMQIEYFLPNEFKSADKELSKHLLELPHTNTIKETLEVFKTLYDPTHPVRFSLETMDSIEEVRNYDKIFRST